MNYRRLGKTELMVSEIGFGGEWMESHNEPEVAEVIAKADELGINILDCWMSNPEVRSSLGKALRGRRDHWIIQGHIGSTWQNGQYVRTRDVEKCKIAFEDLLTRFETDYIDLGMIHFVDQEKDWETVSSGPFFDYVMSLKNDGKIRHIGMSTHNPEIALKAAKSGFIEMMLFSVNPAFDLLPATENIDDYFAEDYGEGKTGMDPIREELYRTCLQEDVDLTVMKPYAGGRLFDASRSPFGVALTPIQCLHYALTRPAVASCLAGYDTIEHVLEAVSYETASEEEKDYGSVLAKAPKHTFAQGQCTYCGHCKPCPKDIDIAMVNKYYDLASIQKEAPSSIQAHYEALSHHASDCIHCKSCETRCPFKVKISDRMSLAANLFKI